MNFNAMFPSKFLRACDLSGEPLHLRIASISTEQMNDGSMKPVLQFQNSRQGLVLNKTNGNMLAMLYGPDTDDWIGQPIVLVATTTDFQGKQVDCIRLRPPAQQKKAPPAADSFDDLDDQIRF